jgi:hypothetical protein
MNIHLPCNGHSPVIRREIKMIQSSTGLLLDISPYLKIIINRSTAQLLGLGDGGSVRAQALYLHTGQHKQNIHASNGSRTHHSNG